MSTKTGVARSNMMLLVDAMKLKGVVMTSSPSPMASARRAMWRPAVPLLQATP